jgi:hypothetical protein
MNITFLMIAAGPALLLLLVSVVLLLGRVRRESVDGARLMLLRGMVWAFGAVLTAYLGAQAVLLAKSNFQEFTLTAFLPIVVFGTAAAAAIWQIKSLKRQATVTR